MKSDLYALGLVLYELFTGKRAFTGKDRDTPPSKPSSHVTGLNPVVESAIERCLEPDPAQRPRSAAEVLALRPGGAEESLAPPGLRPCLNRSRPRVPLRSTRGYNPTALRA